MNQDWNESLFNTIRRVDRLMRVGKPSGAVCPMGAAENSPMFHREIVLVILSDHGGSIPQKQLAQVIRVSPSTLSEMINKLESVGYVERTRSGGDRRAAVIALTEKGAARADEMRARKQEMIAELFSVLTDDEKQQVVAILGKLIADTSDC